MGTRNLTIVISDGITRIAQYGQWDGYPSGQGATALNFLLNTNLEKFKRKLKRCRFFTKRKNAELDKFMKSIGSNDGWMTMEQVAKYKERYSLLSRDNGAEILKLVFESKDRTIWLQDESDFAGDSVFCEWAYVIDFDKRTFEVYSGFNDKPLDENERFAYLKSRDDKKYYPIKLLKEYSLDSLPTMEEFLLLEKEDEEEEDQ